MAVRDAELLGVVIGKPDRAEIILSDYPKESLVDMSLEQLVRIEGLSKAKARTLIAAFELARRGLHKDLGVRPVISAPEDCLHYLTDIRDQQREHFLCLYLNPQEQHEAELLASQFEALARTVFNAAATLRSLGDRSKVDYQLLHIHIGCVLESAPRSAALSIRRPYTVSIP